MKMIFIPSESYLSRIMMLDNDEWIKWLEEAEQATCPHPSKYWVDESAIGTESGIEAGHCSRCGYSFSHIYY